MKQPGSNSGSVIVSLTQQKNNGGVGTPVRGSSSQSRRKIVAQQSMQHMKKQLGSN